MAYGCLRILESNEPLCLKLTSAGFDRVIKHFELFYVSFPRGTVKRSVRLRIVHSNEEASGGSTSEKHEGAQDG